MTPPDEMPDDSTLARIAAGDGSVSEDVTYAQALAMEVLRLRSERDALRARADGAEAKHDALRAAVRECHALERVAADPPPRQALAAAIAADEAWERVAALVGED